MDELTKLIKRSILNEESQGGKLKKKRSSVQRSKAQVQKSNGGFELSSLGPVENSSKIRSLVKQVIKEEIAKGGCCMCNELMCVFSWWTLHTKKI